MVSVRAVQRRPDSCNCGSFSGRAGLGADGRQKAVIISLALLEVAAEIHGFYPDYTVEQLKEVWGIRDVVGTGGI